MGLAASQARLLSITRRMSDNELRAQLINNQKMRLATESSKVSENYIAALNSTNLMFTNYASDNSMQTIPLSFNALTAFNQYNNQYVLSDVSGCVFLREDEARLYELSNGNLEAYLENHGIEYTTTYWDTIVNTWDPNADDYSAKMQEAAVIRAWYETKGINAMSSVSGLEGCSMFPALIALADQISAVHETMNTSQGIRAALIEEAANRLITQDSFNSWFSSGWDDQWDGYYVHWLRYGGHPPDGSDATMGTSRSVFHDFLDNFFEESNENNLQSEFNQVYAALWHYGNNQPLEVDPSTLPSPWNTRLANYTPSSSIMNLDTFFGNSNHPTIYGVYERDINDPTPPAQSNYMFVHYTGYDTGSMEQNDELCVMTPNGMVTLYNDTTWPGGGGPGFNSYNFEMIQIDGQILYGYKPDGNTVQYYFPDPTNTTGTYSYSYLNNHYGGGIIVANPDGSFPDLSGTPDRQQATTWIQEAIKTYMKKELNLGGRISTEDQINRFRELGFSDNEIDIINSLVDDHGLPAMIREFFNMLLGENNVATTWTDGLTSLWCMPNNPTNWDINRAVETVENIAEKLEQFIEHFPEYCHDLTSTLFINDATLPEIILSGEYGGDYEDILHSVYATITDYNQLFAQDPNMGQLYIQFMNFRNNPPELHNYGWLNNQVYDLNVPQLHDNYNLLTEFIYPAALAFFSEHGIPIYGYMKNGQDATAEAEWYTNLFNKIQECGYKSLEKGLASSTDWMRFALENGLGIIEQLSTVDTWNKITYNSCADITEETSSKRTTLAEAEYNKAMNQIEAKDKRLDMELKNIDTEHVSLQQEYESVKKVMNDNIGRVFKLNS